MVSCMRSSLLRSRSLVQRRLPSAQRVLFSYSQPARYPRKQSAPRAASRTVKRASSSSTPSGAAPPGSSASADSQSGRGDASPSAGSPPPEEPDENAEDNGEKPLVQEKVKRARQTKADAETDNPSVFLPPELNILWTPDTMPEVSPSALPPPEIFEEALTDLLITLHPQTQHRSAYASSSLSSSSSSGVSGTVEPTLGLYCPFEGGDYIVDETVRELARRTDSDVIVLDAVHLAAGKAGCFGKGSLFFSHSLKRILLIHIMPYSCVCSAATSKPLTFPCAISTATTDSFKAECEARRRARR